MQMKKRNALGIAGLALAFFLILTGCPQPDADPLNSDATLQSVRVAGVEPVSLGEPSADWEQVVPGVVYLVASQMADAVVETDAASGAYVYLDKKKLGEEPVNFAEVTGESKFTFEHGDLLFVELFSANHDNYLIYAVQIRNRSPVVSNIALNSVFAKSLGTPGKTIAEAVAGEVYFDVSRAGAFLPISVATEREDTEFKVGTGAPPSFDSAQYVKAVNNEFIYVESRSGEESGDTLYYKLQMKAITAPGSITIGGVPVSFGSVGTTFANAGYDAAGQLATFSRSLLSNVEVSITPAPSSALTIRYGWSKASGTAPDTWSSSLGSVHSGSYVGIEVTNPEVGAAYYYKFRVMAASASTTATISAATIDGGPAAPGTIGTAWNNPSTNIVDVSVNGLPKNIVIAATANDNASIRYGTTMAAATAPANWSVNGTLPNVAAGTIIGVEVTSENGATVGYYRFRVKGAGLSSEAAITSVTINNVTAPAGTPGATWNASLANAPIVVPNLPAILTVSAGGISPGATVEYGFSTAAGTAPAWRTAGAFPTGAIGNFIGVRVTAQDGITANIYRFQLVPGTGSNSSITGIKIGNTEYPAGTPRVGAGVWGTPNTWHSPYIDTPTIIVPGLPKDITVTALGAAPNAVVKYGFASVKTTTNNDRPNLDRDTTKPEYANGVTFAAFENGWFICVEVVSPDMTSISTYGFHAVAGTSTDTGISSASIGGVTVSGGDIPTPSVYTSGSIGNPWAGWVAALDTTDVVLSGLPKDITVNVPTLPEGARVLYGSSGSSTQQPNNWNTHGQLTNISTGMFVGIQVISENASKAFYRFRITKGTDTDTSLNGNVTINGQNLAPPVPGETWNNTLETKNVTLSSFSAITVAAAAAAEGSTVSYGTGTSNTAAPVVWSSSGSLTNVAAGSYLGVRVVAANGVTTAYYRFRLVNGTGNTAVITSAAFSGTSATIGGSATSFNPNNPPLAASTVALSRGALLNPLVVSAAGAGKLTIRYGTSAATGTAPTNWNTTGEFPNVTVGTFIGIEVTSEDFSTVRFYKFQVTLE